MSNLVLDESKIDNLNASYEATEKTIIEGSDEHLDFLIDLQKDIKMLIAKTIEVNEMLEVSFNNMSEEEAKNMALKLTIGLNLARQFYRFLKSTPPIIYNGIKSCTTQLYLETKQVDEFLQDILRYKLRKTDELKDLFNEIN